MPGALIGKKITRPGINEAVRRLFCVHVHNFDNHDVISILLMKEDRCNTSFSKNACYIHISFIIGDENGGKKKLGILL